MLSRPTASRHRRLGVGPRPTALAAAALWLILPACGPNGGAPAGEWVSPVGFDTAHVVVAQNGDSVRVLVELAEDQQQKQFGLSRRPSLDPGSGMLFLFDEPRTAEDGFWMWQTRVPLDIAFVDSAGVVQAVLQMEPCQATRVEACPEYAPGVPYATALEVNRGWFAEHGFGVGATVRREP